MGNELHPVQSPEAAEVETQLARILASSHFSGTGRLSSFLEYVVRQSLTGRAEEIKEYTVATVVFGRPDTFDPRLDTIVRVQASKLRARLSDYYSREGSSDPVIIDLPKGRYVPTIRAREIAADPAPAVHAGDGPRRLTLGWRLWLNIIVAFAVLTSTAVVMYRARTQVPADRLALQSGVAVLPFANMNEDSSEEYFTQGLTEELIGALTRIEGLRVPALTSSMVFKDRHDLQEIGRKLRVGAVVEGSALVAGGRVRVAARLVQLKDGSVLWSQDYERPLRDLFAVQVDISRSIVNSLRIQLSGPAARSLVRPEPRSVEAYSLYLKGRFYSHAQAGRWAYDRTAADYFERAIQKDPSFAVAYAALAEWYTSVQARELPLPVSLAKAKEMAYAALRIDDSLPDAQTALGRVNMLTWHWVEAERRFRRAIELNPGDSVAHLDYSRFLMFQARFEEALREAETARDFDPMPSVVSLQVGSVHYYARRYNQAFAEFSKALEADPSSIAARHSIGTVYAREGLFAKAIAEFESLEPPDLPVQVANLRALAHTLAIAGRRGEAERVLSRIREIAENSHDSASADLDWNLALVYAGLGQTATVMEYLGKAYSGQERSLLNIKIEPLLDPIRADPRYAVLLKKLGLS